MRREIQDLNARVISSAKNNEDISELRNKLQKSELNFVEFKADMKARMAMIAVVSSAVTSGIVAFMFHVLTRAAVKVLP